MANPVVSGGLNDLPNLGVNTLAKYLHETSITSGEKIW